MIVIGGCSWAVGEWARGDSRAIDQDPLNGCTHGGLGEFLKQQGHEVCNLGIPAGSNLRALHKVDGWLSRNRQPVDKIFMFQTDYTRDAGMIFPEDYDRIKSVNTLADIMIARYYHGLRQMSTKYQVPVYVIGGVSDTLDPDMIAREYPGVQAVCQSMTNLLIYDSAEIDDPVVSWYTNLAYKLVETLKEKLPDQMPLLIKEIDKGLERESQVFGCTEFFWPDGVHPNRAGHRKLLDFLMDRGHLERVR